MPKTRGTGLLMAWMDVDPAHEDAFNRWYNEEHIGRLLAIPGFLSAARYVALRGAPKYLAMYELEDHNVLRSAAFLDTVRYQPSAERTRFSGGYRRSQLPAERLSPDLPRAHRSDRQHHGPRAVPADGPHRCRCRDGGGVQRLVQHRVHPGLSHRPRLHPCAPLSRRRRPAEIPDGLRVRERRRARYARMVARALRQSMERCACGPMSDWTKARPRCSAGSSRHDDSSCVADALC